MRLPLAKRVRSRETTRGSLLDRVGARRRSRWAAPALLLGALLLTGATYALLAPAQAQPKAADADTVAQGRSLFLVGCSSCHGLNAEGVPASRDGQQYGPSLVGVGAASVDFQVGTGRMPMATSGTQAPRKPAAYNEEETEALAAYVASLGPGPEIPSPELYDTSEATAEEIARGGEFFRTNCTACHNFAGSGGALPRGRYAPKLDGVSNKHIYEALQTGPQQMPVFSDAVLTPEDKRDIIAFLNANEAAPAYGGFKMGSLGPVAEGLVFWLVGMGGAVGFAIWVAAHSTRSTKKKKEAAA